MRLAFIFYLGLAIFSALTAATVVTSNERISGTITEQSKQSVSIRLEDGSVRAVERDRIVQIFDDAGNLVWSSPALLPNAPKNEAAQPAPQARPLDNAILIEGLIGGVTGGFYSEEVRFTDSLGIYRQYSDGSRQNAKNNMITYGFAVNYQRASSARWASLFTYLFRQTDHSVYVGDGQNYSRETLSSQTATIRHALLVGKEARFYPTEGLSSIDIIGQVGYEYGNYYPLATYSDYRSKLSPVPAAYTGPAKVTIHGPTARVGSGISFRFSPEWQLRLLGFYQITYSMASDKIWTAVEKNVLLHDFYGVVSAGYSF